MSAPPVPGADAGAPPPPPGDDASAPPPPPGDDAGAPPPPPGGDDLAPPPAPGADMGAPPPPPDASVVAPPPADTQFQDNSAASMGISQGVHHYTVSPHDSLWKISGKDKIYGDFFQWPLIFIANRDQIKDPDLINPGQHLKIRRDTSSSDVADAVQKAKDTPRFEPHADPREKLPIDY
ncbi:MAG TPA: LysM peptidoglycan-binding domain-containing protein [bacterium]|nr:LysM peptidoglycan-binding domain-containing protein [bacterium]